MRPSGWKQSTLGDVAQFPGGKARVPSGAGVRPSLSFAGLRPSGDLDFGEPVDEREADSKNMTALQPGDVVGTAQGHATGWILKKVGHISSAEPLAYAASTLQVIRPRPDMLDERFLYHYLSWPVTYKRVTDLAGSRRSFTAKMFKSIPIVVPPIEEQRRIAAVLNAAEALRDQRREAIAKLDTLTRAIFFDMFGDPRREEPGRVRLGEVLLLQRGYDLPVSSRSPGPVCVWAANGPVGFHSEARVRGPGVVTGRSGTVGAVHYVESDFWPLNTALFVKDFQGNDPLYCFELLRNIDLKRFSRGVGVPTLNRNLVHDALVPSVPLGQQADFARVARLINRKRERQREHAEILDSLLFSLQQRAFRGQL